MLHRRHFNFSHIPRRSEAKPKRAGARPHPFAAARDEPIVYAGPTLTQAAKEELRQRQAHPGRQPKAKVAAASSGAKENESTAAGKQYFESVLATSFSPRRADSSSTEEVGARILKAWFSGPTMKAGQTSPAELFSPSDPSRPTASELRRQGLPVVGALHRGDGFVSGAERLQLRREYAEEVYGYRRLRRHSRRPMAATPQPTPTSELVAGVFVKAGDVGSYIRQDALHAANGMPRADVRRGIKVRLGGTSKPRH
uniref:Uncharacterized protein n=1 Tax=Neobodo designis TaxID=312471 RepID=A0A7S1W3U0_NEODS